MRKRKKTALITGGGAGLGRAISITLAKQGCQIFITGRRKEKLEEVANLVERDDTVIFSADITLEKDVKALYEKVIEHTGGTLSLLVNNVGGVPAMGAVADMSLTDWKKVIDVNLTSQFFVTKTFLPALRKNNGAKILSVTSGMANYFMNGFAAYSAGKAGVESLMKTVEVEEKDNAISVALFDPENVVTEGNPEGEKDPMEMMDKMLAMLK